MSIFISILNWKSKRHFPYTHYALKVPFNFHFKIRMENDIFCISVSIQNWKLKKENFQFSFFVEKLKNKIFIFRFSIFILLQNTKLPLIKLTIIRVNPLNLVQMKGKMILSCLKALKTKYVHSHDKSVLNVLDILKKCIQKKQ